MTNSTKILAAFGLVAGLGVAAALPVTMAEPGHAATTADTVINATVNESIAISTTSPTINLTLGVSETKTETGNFTVSTNHAAGYKVSVQGTRASGDASALVNGSNSIPYAANPDAGNAGWSLTVGGNTPSSIATSTDVVTKTAASAAAGDKYDVTYKVTTKADQPQGAYDGKVTYTAQMNS